MSWLHSLLRSKATACPGKDPRYTGICDIVVIDEQRSLREKVILGLIV
jgi:hypothetical protein